MHEGERLRIDRLVQAPPLDDVLLALTGVRCANAARPPEIKRQRLR